MVSPADRLPAGTIDAGPAGHGAVDPTYAQWAA
jgi:hypothetical protein